jgi:hypothetical protein
MVKHPQLMIVGKLWMPSMPWEDELSFLSMGDAQLW